MLGERRAPTRRGARHETVSHGDVAWILLLPFAALAAPVVLVLASWLGDVAFPAPDLHYWYAAGRVRKPDVQAGYVLGLACVGAYAATTFVVARRELLQLRPAWRRALVLAAQLLTVALVAVCWVAQVRLDVLGTRRAYFTPATIVAAVLVAALLALAARRWDDLPARLRRLLAVDGSRLRALACWGAAALVTVVWLLPAVYGDAGIALLDAAGRLLPPPELYGNAYYFDEASAILDGRSPLVDMPAYASLWPYLIALPFRALGATYAAFTAIMALVTGASLLAVYAVLRRLAGDLLALALFAAFVATSFFIERGTAAWRYDPGNYFGVFPLRYAGPFLLLWLTARRAGRPPGRFGDVPLFAFAGLVALNNVDFGASAFAATVAAVAIGRRPRAARLAAEVAAGALAALAAVSVLTLLRAGTLPHLGLLGHYGRVFVDGGAGNIALAGIGWHVVMSATFVAALAIAVVRAAGDDRGLLTATLAWAGIFGLGASAYFYAYRSHPDVLLNLFSSWALALSLLAIVVLRAERLRRGVPALPGLLVLLGVGLAACSLAQLPPPWTQVARLAEAGGSERPLALPELTALVDERTHDGERVVIFAPVGHRVARAAGVVNVSPYPGLGQMPAVEQLTDTLALLRREGGDVVFVAQVMPPGMAGYLRRNGWRRVAVADGIGWSGEPVIVLRPPGASGSARPAAD